MPAAARSEPLLPRLSAPDDAPALTLGGVSRSYRELAGAAGVVAERLRADGVTRVAVWAESTLSCCVAVLGALGAGATVVPVNPGYGARELEHLVTDAAPELLLADAQTELPPQLATIPRHAVDPLADGPSALPDASDADPTGETTAFILYTSGTTGPPKGAMIPRRAVAANLDALAEVWSWTAQDRLAHGLPLFHVHGLILGLLGPLRRGAQVEHVGRFGSAALADALRRGATMVFGVPTMYGRVIDDAQDDPAIGAAFAGARLLVSGSAALPAIVRERLEALTGCALVERYGLTETLILTAMRPGESIAGTVGPPLPGVEIRLLDDGGAPISPDDHETIGELSASGPSIFTGYLNRPDATAEALRDGWFHTGDLATWAPGGGVRIVGRRATDLIKSGGFKIGAGEIEAALLEHPGVAEVAVAGRPDEDLGERVVAWVVRAEGTATESAELRAHVGGLLAFYKRPREVRFTDALPRNAMGKVTKTALEP